MRSSFAYRLEARRRLQILLLLAESPRYAAHESALVAGMPELGVAASHDVVRSDVDWLFRQDLLDVSDADGGRVVTANQRGLDVAAGLAAWPGIARPQPEDLKRCST
ncbi:MAG: ArsR family transcriptional regulator [Burkholderiales bacterium]|nr:ArsR family transcriptional regulator [Burkholderiales bacterium]